MPVNESAMIEDDAGKPEEIIPQKEEVIKKDRANDIVKQESVPKEVAPEQTVVLEAKPIVME